MQPGAPPPFINDNEPVADPFGSDRPPSPASLPWLTSPRTFSERWSEFWDQPAAQKGLKIAAIAGGISLVAGIVCWNVLFFGMPKLPRAEELWTLNREPAVQFVDASGQTVAVRGNLYGPVVHSSDLPAYVGQAFIAAEDQRFMDHDGVDLQSISRAIFANLSAGKTVQGGSTLTQQLVKNLLVGNDQTLRRKAQEARLAVEMESVLSKQEILDLYLNRVYLGANAYGVEAAAHAYFGKPAADLSLGEAAFLGALPKAPSRYAENKTAPETTARVDYVLDRMAASGFVSRNEAAAAKAQTLAFAETSALPPISGYVLDVAMDEARTVVPDLPPDAVITLTVDEALQRKAESALKTALNVRSLGAKEGAIVVMDRDGAIKALVGGRDYKTSQFNRATQALRQPGSAFKTFVYAAALERGLEPTTVRDDAPVELAGWAPGNYDDSYLGPITLARALAVSSNSVAAQIGAEVGPKRIVALAKRFGIDSPLHAYPSIALGADEVTLLEMTRAYGVLANEGVRPRSHIVSEIRDQRGAVLFRAVQTQPERVYNVKAARMMTGMLANVVQSGTGAQARISGWQIAGKTGTSQAWRDAWFVGYSARLVAGVWIGNDDDRPTRKATGGSAAAALFAKVMAPAHRGMKPEPLPGGDLGGAWLDADLVEQFWDEVPALDQTTDPAHPSLSPFEANAGAEDQLVQPVPPAEPRAVEPVTAHLPVDAETVPAPSPPPLGPDSRTLSRAPGVENQNPDPDIIPASPAEAAPAARPIP